MLFHSLFPHERAAGKWRKTPRLAPRLVRVGRLQVPETGISEGFPGGRRGLVSLRVRNERAPQAEAEIASLHTELTELYSTVQDPAHMHIFGCGWEGRKVEGHMRCADGD